ncbi:MAG: ADP-ribose pyrophosphatase [Candidatus Atribacteria bacterium]|nr:ADP-ribose pyrophosphatase [Candidatus Atribacteria bacterium]
MFYPYTKEEVEKLEVPTKLSEKTILSTPIFKVVESQFSKDMKRVFIRHPGAVAILATTLENKLVLIKQFRAAIGEWLWEIPAGTLEPDESPLSCAQRELEEETGFISSQWKYLFPIYLAPGYSSECIHLFRAEQAYPVQDPRAGDQDELIFRWEITREEVKEMLTKREIKDAKTMVAIQNWEEGK